MNQLIKVCDALDLRFLQIKYNDDEGEGCAAAEKYDNVVSQSCRITIGGMTCSACSSSITQKLEGIHGVHRASVSSAIGRATVAYDNSMVRPDDLLRAVKTAGYDATLQVQSAFDTIQRLRYSNEILEIKEAVSSASLYSTAIITFEYLAMTLDNSGSPSYFSHFSVCLALLLAAKVQIIDAWPIHQRAWLRHGKLNLTMDILLSSSLLLGIGLTLLQVSLRQHQNRLAYASSGSFLTIVILAGKYLEAVLKREGNRNLAALYELQNDVEMYQLANDDVSRMISSYGKSLTNADVGTSFSAEEE